MKDDEIQLGEPPPNQSATVCFVQDWGESRPNVSGDYFLPIKSIPRFEGWGPTSAIVQGPGPRPERESFVPLDIALINRLGHEMNLRYAKQ